MTNSFTKVDVAFDNRQVHMNVGVDPALAKAAQQQAYAVGAQQATSTAGAFVQQVTAEAAATVDAERQLTNTIRSQAEQQVLNVTASAKAAVSEADQRAADATKAATEAQQQTQQVVSLSLIHI